MSLPICQKLVDVDLHKLKYIMLFVAAELCLKCQRLLACHECAISNICKRFPVLFHFHAAYLGFVSTCSEGTFSKFHLTGLGDIKISALRKKARCLH